MARRDAVRMPVKGELYDGATDLLLAEATAGKRVVRLSVAEASLEETVSVAAEGIAFETVPAVALPKPADIIPFPPREDSRGETLRAAS
jgi:siroheme synthase